jgi:hypothetical protein
MAREGVVGRMAEAARNRRGGRRDGPGGRIGAHSGLFVVRGNADDQRRDGDTDEQ